MHDILFRISDRFAIHSYGVMAMIGFLAALFVARWRARKAGLLPDEITDICHLGAARRHRRLADRLRCSRTAATSSTPAGRIGPPRPLQNLARRPGLLRRAHRRADRHAAAAPGQEAESAAGARRAGAVARARPGVRADRLLPARLLLRRARSRGRVVRLRFSAPNFGSLRRRSALVTDSRRALRLWPTELVSSFDLFCIFIILSLFFRHQRRSGEVMALYLILSRSSGSSWSSSAATRTCPAR